jgi:hypothetical protein
MTEPSMKARPEPRIEAASVAVGRRHGRAAVASARLTSQGLGADVLMPLNLPDRQRQVNGILGQKRPHLVEQFGGRSAMQYKMTRQAKQRGADARNQDEAGQDGTQDRTQDGPVSARH